MIEVYPNIKATSLGLFEELKKEKKRLIASKAILDKKDNHEYPITDIPFEIPTHWVWCYLSDISLIQEGPGIRKHQYETSGVQFLTVTNILEGSVDLEKSKKYISKEQYNNYSHFTINKGDIVTACSGGSWGKSAIYDLDEKLILNTSTLRLRFYNDLGDNYYLYYLTKTSYFKDSLSKYITGQQPNYGYSHYSKIPIPLPPLPEQQRIVAILDEAFAAIAKAKANAEQNLKNSRELFESLLINIFTEGINIKKWSLEKLERYNKVVVGYVGPISKEYTNDEAGVLLLSTKNISDKGVSLEKLTRINHRFHNKNVKSKLVPGDILVARHGNSGQSAVIPNNIKEAHALNVIVIKKSETLSSEYICFLLNSGVLDKIASSKAGSVQEIINTSIIKDLIIPVPSFKEQQSIVQKLDALFAETKKLEAIYRQKIDDLEELKKSILQKAFSGEL